MLFAMFINAIFIPLFGLLSSSNISISNSAIPELINNGALFPLESSPSPSSSLFK